LWHSHLRLRELAVDTLVESACQLAAPSVVAEDTPVVPVAELVFDYLGLLDSCCLVPTVAAKLM
jgi:hypothetical protein